LARNLIGIRPLFAVTKAGLDGLRMANKAYLTTFHAGTAFTYNRLMGYPMQFKALPSSPVVLPTNVIFPTLGSRNGGLP
jgi:hypothetical protein